MSKVVIYSSALIAGLDGAYRNPAFFEAVEKDAKLVYTDRDDIKKQYEQIDIEVKPLPKKKTNKRQKG